MNIIGRQETILQLFPGEDLGTITNGITRAIHASFAEQSMRNPTRAEVRHRFDICFKWAKVMRGDLKWGLARIVDTVPEALRAELLGQEYTPSTRQCWIPTDGG